jgi:hypothetical protein
MRMTSQLRPLSLGEILDRTAELYRNNFLLFAGISAIFSGAMLLTQLVHLGMLAAIGYPIVPPGFQWVVASAVVVEVLVVLLLAGLSIVANNRAVAWVHLGQPATIRDATRSTLPHLRRYLWLMTVTSFRAWAPLAALYVVMFAILFSILPKGWLTNPSVLQHMQNVNPASLVAAGIGLLVIVPLFFLALIYGVLMSLRYSLAMPACVVEELTAAQSIKRSIQLSKGARGRIFVLGLLVYAVRLLLGILLGFPFIALAIKHPGQPLPLGWLTMQQVAGFVVKTLIGPIYATGLTLFYYDQRIRNEGFDIEWMMRSAGLASEVAAPTPE